MLGLPDMGYWDIYPPLVKSDRTYSLAEMRQLTSEAVKPLGDDYVKLFTRLERQTLDGSASAAGQGIGRLHEAGLRRSPLSDA